MTEITGVADFPLTSFSNDITTMSELTVTDFTATRLNSNLVPYSNDTLSLGTSNQRFKDIYLSGNLVFVDGTSMDTKSIETSEGGTRGSI